MKRRLAPILGSLLVASTMPVCAGEAGTQAVELSVSVSDTAPAAAETAAWQEENDVIQASQSVSGTDTVPENMEESKPPETWTETYTYLSDTQEPHAFPECIEKGEIEYSLQDVQYSITELREEYCIVSPDMWAANEYTPAQEIEVNGLHYTLTETTREDWQQTGRTRNVSTGQIYLEGQEVPEQLDVESTDTVTGEKIYGTIPRTDLLEDGANWKEGALEEWVTYRWTGEQWVLDVDGEAFPTADKENPWFEGCHIKVLQYLHLDGTFNQATGIVWDGDTWEDENGVWWRKAKVTGNRMVKRYWVPFSGDIAQPDLPMVRYTSHYTSDVTGYLITATVTYRETVPETIQSVSVPDTDSRGKGSSLQDAAMLLLEVVCIALAAAAVVLTVWFRPRSRAWKNK